MRKALIISTDSFPKGNAGATRQEVLAKLFVELDMNVDVIGLGEYTGFNFITLLDRIRYISYRGKQKNIFDRIFDRLMYSHRVKRHLKYSMKYDVILVVSVSRSLLSYLIKYKKKNNVILIHDSVEWYSSSCFRLGVLSPAYIEKNLMNTKWIDTNFRVIGISTYLESYFKNKGCITQRIPFIYDVLENKCVEKEHNTKIVFIYAGLIGKKDHLHNFLVALTLLSKEEKERIEVRLFGFGWDELKRNGHVNDQLIKEVEGIVFVKGRVSRECVESNMSEADFSLLFRNPEERYAQAGFPTKVVESMSHSTPVFCNLSSDLGLYLFDGKNCILSETEGVNDILIGIKRILALSDDERKRMRHKARETALVAFDYRRYIKQMQLLVEK